VSAFDKAKNIQSIIGSLVTVDASGLVSVPIETNQPRDAIRKLQIQNFELADALAATVKELEDLRAQVNGLRNRR
jgi:hypothetical protein